MSSVRSHTKQLKRRRGGLVVRGELTRYVVYDLAKLLAVSGVPTCVVTPTWVLEA